MDKQMPDTSKSDPKPKETENQHDTADQEEVVDLEPEGNESEDEARQQFVAKFMALKLLKATKDEYNKTLSKVEEQIKTNSKLECILEAKLYKLDQLTKAEKEEQIIVGLDEELSWMEDDVVESMENLHKVNDLLKNVNTAMPTAKFDHNRLAQSMMHNICTLKEIKKKISTTIKLGASSQKPAVTDLKKNLDDITQMKHEGRIFMRGVESELRHACLLSNLDG